MKIGTSKEKLLQAAILAERLTAKKESLPILSCVYLSAEKHFTIRATNLEAGIEVVIPAEVQEKGAIAVPASVFSQTIRSVSGDKVTLSSEEGNLLIESRGTKTLIKAVSHEEFPSLPFLDGNKKVSVSREKFLRGIAMVSYAASSSMIRPELGSVSVVIKDGGITMAATDSFRLAEKKVMAAAGKNDADLLVPVKHVSELNYILDHVDEEEVDLVFDDSQMTLVCPDLRYVSRVVDGNFPNYREIIPKSFTTEATILKSDFVEMLRKGRVFAGTDQHIGFHIYPKKKIFTATARSADIGEMSDSVDAALSGEDLDINFHIGYLSDCLSSIDSESILLGFSGVGRALVIRGVSDSSFLYLVMPLNR